jgi:hypothetical protein
MGDHANPDMLVLPGGAADRTERHGRISVAAPDIGRGLRRRIGVRFWRRAVGKQSSRDLVGGRGVHAAGTAGGTMHGLRISTARFRLQFSQ